MPDRGATNDRSPNAPIFWLPHLGSGATIETASELSGQAGAVGTPGCRWLIRFSLDEC